MLCFVRHSTYRDEGLFKFSESVVNMECGRSGRVLKAPTYHFAGGIAASFTLAFAGPSTSRPIGRANYRTM